jgi:hypothetical protein
VLLTVLLTVLLPCQLIRCELLIVLLLAALLLPTVLLPCQLIHASDGAAAAAADCVISATHRVECLVGILQDHPVGAHDARHDVEQNQTPARQPGRESKAV